MILRSGEACVALDPSERASFGRGPDSDFIVGSDPVDRLVSRRAGEVRFEGGTWIIMNTGRRPMFIVEPAGETELRPPGTGGSEAPVLYNDCWLRLPGTSRDHAIELSVPASERPPLAIVLSSDSTLATIVETRVVLTANELQSVLAIYESYLALPPFYHREPRSFRAAGYRLGVAEGKVKADLRRVQDKVARAGGPADGGLRYRDALISWLMSREVVQRDQLGMLQRRPR